MDFKKFQQWCENKGFVFKLPSGYSKLINLEVSSFESFKGIFNLCMIFFYEELYKQRENEKEDGLRKFIEKYKDSPTILYPADDYSSPYIYYKKDGESFVEKIRDAGVNKNKSSWNLDVKYSDEDFEKVFNYLLTSNEDNGIIPMDRLLNYLEDKEKYENSELKSLVDKVAEKYDSED